MFANSPGPRAARRGIVLVLVLGMLALLALIGVTFATFAGQSLINGRNFVQGVGRPQSDALMDYAISQLINDTNNPLSSIRGHSLLRDMYGNDSLFRGSNPPLNRAAETGGFLTQVSYGSPPQSHALQFTAYNQHPTTNPTPFFNQLQYATNIPTGGQYYGLDFTRWIVRFSGGVGQTFEVLEDDATGGVHLFTLSANLANPTNDTPGASGSVSSSDWTSFIYANPNLGATYTSGSPNTVAKGYTQLSTELNLTSGSFVLDGRYMRAFNGPGMTRLVTGTDSSGNPISAYPFNQAAHANFRLARLLASNFAAFIGDPDTLGMDEDYDACDLENWFLAIQSADGQVMIPSFHRPGILVYPGGTLPSDWTLAADDTSALNVSRRSKILRPRQIDNSPLFPADPSVLDANGKLTYDIDNDGDGVTDSVWLDLGYPVQRDPNGRLYKPLFAFMVLGLNGRMPLNTAGNLQSRAIGDQTSAPPSGLISSSQVPYPGYYTSGGTFNSLYTAAAYYDSPTWDHASHLGYSVNEINPKFALQNAPSNVYPSANGGPTGTGSAISPFGGFPSTTAPVSYSQYDNVGISLALNQLRNLLAGTVPAGTGNNEGNFVDVDGQTYPLPNNVADGSDTSTTANGSTFVARNVPPVPGRWGETEGVPTALQFPPINATSTFDQSTPMYWYNNTVRAGRSVYTGGTNDIMDDDFDATDPYLASSFEIPTVNPKQFSLVQTLPSGTSNQYTLPVGGNYTANYSFQRIIPESVDSFDNAGQMRIASEASRRFVTPQDPAGVGRVLSFMTRPINDSDYGNGYDAKGRTSFFRYFRPAGMPQEVRYPYSNANSTFPYAYATGSGLGHQYLMPVLFPAGYTASVGAPPGTPGSKSDIHNNRYHGFQSMLTPAINDIARPQYVAVSGAMPYDNSYDYSTSTNNTPAGDGGYTPAVAASAGPPVVTASPGTPAASPNLLVPTINPSTSTVLTAVNSENGPNLGASASGPYAIPYAAPVVNGYLGGSLNKDEADEMNVYTTTRFDMPYGPSDLEWLYRKQDVDGATLNSRLSQLAPISFLNPADGLTRRRLFSTDVFDLTGFVYANDNPTPYAGAAYGASTDHDFRYNSRFGHNASPSLENMNQVTAINDYSPFANYIATEFLPNVTLPPQAVYGTTLSPNTHYGNTIIDSIPNSSFSASSPWKLPLPLNPAKPSTLFSNAQTNAVVDSYSGLVIPSGGQNSGIPLSMAQVQTPALAHRDRRINLNMPLPISNEPAEPIRQKWVRETYQLLKAILPPASVDTPEELAALSQYVVNIIDFRDPDCTMTRFVNTDLEVTDVLTKSASNSQPDAMGNYEAAWTVSPAGVRFAQSSIPDGHFPYDPSLYSPDTTSPFLVQHGMEYNPIALNEAMAYQAQYGATTDAPSLTTYQAMFIELVNTLTEEQGNANSTANASAISLEGWDIVVVPDNYGWGRPDPISGNVAQVALPPLTPNAMGDPTMPPAATQNPYSAAMDTNLKQLALAVQQYTFRRGATIKGITGGTAVDHYVVGDYRTNDSSTGSPPNAGTTIADPTTVEGTNPVAKSTEINVRLPDSSDPDPFVIPTTTNGTAQYYWVYLRRPANPFDVAAPNQVRPNKEMVVVDAMRFPVIDASNGVFTPATATNAPRVTTPNAIYSAQRMQPYRGAHLLRVDTPVIAASSSPPPITAPPTTGPASGVTTLCPPTPAYAYGYSEQVSAPPTGNGQGQYKYTKPSTGTLNTTNTFQQSINNNNGVNDSSWNYFPFHDRDFSSIAELLMVPGCPPGLFTKQFVEEAYPGNVFADTNGTTGTPPTSATGTDNRDFGTPFWAGSTPFATSPIAAPTGATNPSLVGRKDFSVNTGTPALPPNCTYPYLPDNFYYTAASIAPPPAPASGSFDAGYTSLTTEVGGWTGNGWFKMFEFFEVPSSANGAVGAAEAGNNFDWYRADTRPGQLNINLIIDEEVFAGLIDDPRLNEHIAAYSASSPLVYFSSVVPLVVTQIDGNGYPVHDPNNSNAVVGCHLLFNHPSSNGGSTVMTPAANTNGALITSPVGRGYVYRDPDPNNYDQTRTDYPYYQQVHGLKAAFSDFLKLRHGGSGFLFGFGAGPTGSGNFLAALPSPFQTQPIAAERPYRSLSYPDINYTIMRPASLPPSLTDPNNASPNQVVPGTPTPLPPALKNLFGYIQHTGAPFVQLNLPWAPMNNGANGPSGAADFPYTFDPGVKNPYLSTQYLNTTAYNDAPAGSRHLAPPYAASAPSTTTPSAPFPPPIPPTPARRLIQVPDYSPAQAASGTGQTSNASLLGQQDLAYSYTVATELANPMGPQPTAAQIARRYPVNQPTTTTQAPMAETSIQIPNSGTPPPPFTPSSAPPSLVPEQRLRFAADNYNPSNFVIANNLLGAGPTAGVPVAPIYDRRQHPAYRTEWLQKAMNLTTVRTHQFAVWITVGFFEVVATGTPELGIADVLGQELGLTAGKNVRYRSFFVVDRTKATGFNPYYPGNFRDCVTYRRRIE